MTKPTKPREPALEPYVRGDPIPLPDASETNTETTWALFSELSATENMRYADTVPLTAPGAGVPDLPRPGGARVKLLASLVGRPVSTETVMQLARQNQRVCPQPAPWQQLYELLLARRREPDAPGPMPVLDAAAWRATPELAKRMCLRSQVEWAAAQGCLGAMHAFLNGLREEDWHHAR